MPRLDWRLSSPPAQMTHLHKPTFAPLLTVFLEYEYDKHSVSLQSESSKWRVSSALQKCIRRGLQSEAVFFAQALINGGQSEYFWTRIPVIALEDVGPSASKLCNFVLHCSRYKSYRQQFGDELKLASFIVSSLALSPKTRFWCDILCGWHFDVSLSHTPTHPHEEFQRARSLARNDASLLGVDGAPSLPPKSVDAVLLRAQEKGLSPDLYEALVSSTKKSVYGLHSSILAAWEVDPFTEYLLEDEAEHTAGETVGGIPLFAYDQHTVEGKKALSYLVKSLELETYHPYLANAKALGMALFQVESALLNNKACTPVSERIKACNDELELITVGIPVEHHQDCRDFLRLPDVKSEITRAKKRVLKAL